jgi:hypothetical protein
MGQLMRFISLKSRIVALCAALLLASASYALFGPRAEHNYDQYAEEVIAVAKHSGRVKVNSFYELWTAPDFDALASEAPAHVDDCIKFLLDSKYTDLQKDHAVWAMYKLPLRDYLAFVRKIFDLYDSGHDIEEGLRIALTPHPSFVPRNVIFDNYRDPEVRALMRDIAARPGWHQDEKEFLDWLMAGGVAEYSQQVIAVAKGLEGTITLKGLWTASDFDVLASMAPAHVDDCLKFLEDPEHTAVQKAFAIWSMYKLPPRDYLTFVREALALYDRGASSGKELVTAVTPRQYIVPKNAIFDNYDDPEVRTLLHEIAARPGLSEQNRRSINWVMEGGGYEYRFNKNAHAIMRYLGVEDEAGNYAYPWSASKPHRD